MIETFENSLQLLVTGICTVYSIVQALKKQNRSWMLLGLHYALIFMGDLYWTMYLVFYAETPYLNYIPNLSWAAADLFLILMLQYIRPAHFKRIPKLMWLIPVFTGGMFFFFIQWGDYLINLLDGLLMAMILWSACRGLYALKEAPQEKARYQWVYFIAIAFFFVEYALWTSSCFWSGDTLANPYIWFDLLLSVVWLLFLPAVGKAVGP